MSKIIKLMDEVYLLLQNEANKNGRSMAGQIKFFLSSPPVDEWKGVTEIEGQFKPSAFPCCKKATPCKHWVWDGEKGWVNIITGDIRND